MKIPYNQVHINGTVLFAARSGRIHSFSLPGGKLIAAWHHPDVEKVSKAIESNRAAETPSLVIEASTEVSTPQTPQDDDDGPPAKRQKTAVEEDVSASKPAEETSTKKGGKKAKDRKKDKPRVSRVPDRPIVTHLTSTPDGKHVLAVTGHDKTIWVFEHDGKGNLTPISQRAMPKRPSAIEISSDSQIICGDKFGDVYSLPLIQDASWVAQKPAPKARNKPAANELTVHSQRNLEALRDQQKQIEKDLQAKAEDKEDGVNFEMHLLLGHVSMLTALTLGEEDGLKYIISGDRDEHVRVSRYIPQAYVIENFCFGHEHFIGALHTPPTRPEILVSGGGDDELFVWKWLGGEQLSTTSVLTLAQQINPDLKKVAVTNLYSLEYGTDSGKLTYVLAICEGIKAIFSWQLTDENVLNHPGVTQLPGNPQSLAVEVSRDAAPKIVVALDPGSGVSAKSVHVFSLTLNEGRLSVDSITHVEEEAVDTPDLEMDAEEVGNLLYNIEHLRKQKEIESEGAEEGAEEELSELQGAE